MYYRILYTSKASDKLKSSDIVDIIATAQAHNKTIGVTGMLMFIEDGFLQYLEGQEDDVMTLYNKISKDDRHQDCKIILQGRTGHHKRHFESWNMGLKILTKQDIEDVRALNNNANFDLFEELNSHPDIAKQLMKYFYNHGEIDFRKFWSADNSIKGI